MAEGIKTTCTGFLSSRKGAAPAEAQKKGTYCLIPYLALRNASPTVHQLENENMVLKIKVWLLKDVTSTQNRRRSGSVWCVFPLWHHPCSQGLIIRRAFLYIYRNKPLLCSTQTEATVAWNSRPVWMTFQGSDKKFRRAVFYMESFTHWN